MEFFISVALVAFSVYILLQAAVVFKVLKLMEAYQPIVVTLVRQMTKTLEENEEED